MQLLAHRTDEIPIELPVCHIIFWHVCTQRTWKRPNGVGLLVAGLEESGAHLYYNCPSAYCFKSQAFAIRSHSQAAKTYLECRFEKFIESSRDLVKDVLIVLRKTLQGEKPKSSICVVAVSQSGRATPHTRTG